MKADNSSSIDYFGYLIFPAASERNDNFRFDFTRYTISDTEPTSAKPQMNIRSTRPESMVDLTQLNSDRLNDLLRM